MKTLIILSTSLLVYFTAFQSTYSTCSKKKILEQPVSVNNNNECLPVTIDILTANPWKIKEDRGVVGGSLMYYSRGGSNNVESFDKEYIVFNADKTGTHYYNDGGKTNFTWKFANNEQTKIIWSVRNTPASFDLVWDNIRYKNNNLYLDQYYTDGNTGNHSHSQQIRMPK
jgi:hypothetical protein